MDELMRLHIKLKEDLAYYRSKVKEVEALLGAIEKSMRAYDQ